MVVPKSRTSLKIERTHPFFCRDFSDNFTVSKKIIKDKPFVSKFVFLKYKMSGFIDRSEFYRSRPIYFDFNF